jgi:hypothetical protein
MKAYTHYVACLIRPINFAILILNHVSDYLGRLLRDRKISWPASLCASLASLHS